MAGIPFKFIFKFWQICFQKANLAIQRRAGVLGVFCALRLTKPAVMNMAYFKNRPKDLY